MKNQIGDSPESEMDLDFLKEVENEAQLNEAAKDDPFKGTKIKESVPFEYAEDAVENGSSDDM